MKRNSYVTAMLAALLLALACAPAVLAQDPGSKPATIQDPAEYNTFMAAMGMTNQAQKAAAFEQYLIQYPNSVVKKDAMVQMLGAYLNVGNIPKAADAASKLLLLDANNVTALYTLAVSKRAACESSAATADCKDALQYGQKGLGAVENFAKPPGMTDDAYQNTKKQLSAYFNGAAGRGALAAKDYETAQKYFRAAVEANPDNLADVYPLSVAYLSPRPMNVQGLWFGARAVNLSKNNAQILTYAKKSYAYYHGGDDGWDALLVKAQGTGLPPADFSVAPAPTPVDQAKKYVNKDPKDISLDDMQIICTYSEQSDVDKVMTELKASPFGFQGKVIEADKDKLIMAGTYDGIQNNSADTEVLMAAPIPAAKMPKVNSIIAVAATPASCDKSPYKMHMTDGRLVVSKPAPGAHHAPPPRHKKP